MVNTKFFICGFFCLLLTGHLLYAQKSEQEIVKKSFDSYKAAILNEQGEEAVKFVDSRTVKYFGEMLELVKTADSSKIETLSILDKLMVFSVRHRTSKEDILSFDGKALLVYAIKHGMVGKNSVANNSIGDVVIENDFAKGQLIVNEKRAPIYFHFYKEEGTWKIDLTSIFPVTTLAFNKMADESGENQSNYLLSILEIITGRKPSLEIWQPIK